ncbi:MAG TPA: alpha/beta hydrolase [Polyangiaceae bacterium]|jgi:pimeloyl-ACP methyl ester carboxylesterase|nr:alpha/beta hydrolase [Polyangiaceae bacterium]
MPTLVRGETSIHYEVKGEGYPLVLFAPGGMRSSIALWDRSPFHPIRELSSKYRVVAMDQRNAGRSRAPVNAADGWDTYTDDHIALLDELGIERCHILGMCIGSAFCLRLLSRMPERISAAVLEQPIGLSGDNRGVFYEMFDGWAEELATARPDVARAALSSFRHNLYDGDFAFSVSREQVKKCEVPLLVLRGNDIYHPSETSEEIARTAPNGILIQAWKEGDAVSRALVRVTEFLRANTPS